MAKEILFYNPQDAGVIPFGITQKNKILPFKSIDGVFLPGCFVSVYNVDTLVKKYIIGDGITIVGTNTSGVEKTAQCILNGADFIGFEGKTLRMECYFFIDGDIEIIFDLIIR